MGFQDGPAAGGGGRGGAAVGGRAGVDRCFWLPVGGARPDRPAHRHYPGAGRSSFSAWSCPWAGWPGRRLPGRGPELAQGTPDEVRANDTVIEAQRPVVCVPAQPRRRRREPAPRFRGSGEVAGVGGVPFEAAGHPGADAVHEEAEFGGGDGPQGPVGGLEVADQVVVDVDGHLGGLLE